MRVYRGGSEIFAVCSATVAASGSAKSRPVAVAGAKVAAYTEDIEVPQIGLSVYDLRRRRLVRSSSLSPSKLVVTAGKGWIAGTMGNDAGSIDVAVADDVGDSDFCVVASGDDIDPNSPRISGRTISWLQAGTRHTFRLGTLKG